MQGVSRERRRPRKRRGRHAHQLQIMRLLNNGKLPFDFTLFEDFFPSVTPAQDETALTDALLKRNTELTPSTEEMQTIQNLVTRVQGILEALILIPGTFDACKIDEVRQVGSFKQGTILSGHKTADFVVILKSLPTLEAVASLSNRVSEELLQTEPVLSAITDRGFDLSILEATIRVFITTVPQNFRKLDPEFHINHKLVTEHWHALRHSRWFEENGHNSTIKVLIRILRDLRQRYIAFLPLSTWMLDLLAHYCVLNNPLGQPLPLNKAFRRTLSLMSCGMYLPGYAGTAMRGHNLSCEEQDMATGTAQTLLRILAQGGYKVILGLETDKKSDIVTIPNVWDDDVVIFPMEKVFEEPADGEVEIMEQDENEEKMEDAPMNPETA